MEFNHQYVFISYSSRNYDAALELKNFLNINNIDCWMAPQSIPAGSDYATEIPAAIGGCGAFVLLLTAEAQTSNWVPKELDLAITRNRRVIPFQIDAADLSAPFEFRLTNVQRIMAHGRLDEAYEELIREIGGTAEAVPQEDGETSSVKTGEIQRACVDALIPTIFDTMCVQGGVFFCGDDDVDGDSGDMDDAGNDFLLDEMIEQCLSNPVSEEKSPIEKRIETMKGRKFVESLRSPTNREGAFFEPVDVVLTSTMNGKQFSLQNLPGIVTVMFEVYSVYDSRTSSRYFSLRQLESVESEDRSYTTFFWETPNQKYILVMLSFHKMDEDGNFEVYINNAMLFQDELKVLRQPTLFRLKSWYLPKTIRLDDNTYDTENISGEARKKLFEQTIPQEAEWVDTDLRNAPAMVIDPENVTPVLREVYFDEDDQCLKARIQIVPYKGYFVFRVFDENKTTYVPLTDVELGYLYRSGLHSFPRDPMLAVRHFERDGSPNSIYQIAGIFATEEELRDEELHLEYLQMAADMGAESAIAELAEHHVRKGDPASVRWAGELFSRIADPDGTIGNFLYACCMEKGLFGPVDSETIFDHYFKAACNDFRPALARLRCCYDDLQAPDALYPLFRESLVNGTSNVDYCLGCTWFYGLGLYPRKREGLKLLREAADRGYQQSIWSLLEIYDNDSEYQNKKEALNWMIEVEKFDPSVRVKLANRLIDGVGCACSGENDALAFELFRKAAECGNKSAIHNLGWMYKKGRGCAVDYEKAMQLFEKAKAPNSFFQLGNMYEKGLGVEADMEKAVELYEIGSRKGSKKAKQRLEELKRAEKDQ